MGNCTASPILQQIKRVIFVVIATVVGVCQQHIQVHLSMVEELVDF